MTRADIRHAQDGGEVTIRITGEIDLANRDDVEQQLNAAITNQVTLVQIDLGAVRYIDSAGIRVLFTLATRLDRLQTRFELVAPEGSLARRLLELAGLDNVARLLPERTDFA